MRNRFHEQLESLHNQIVRMGQLVIELIENATLSLARQDEELARQVIAADDEVDQLQIDVQMEALRLMALQQPMASDLRRIATGLKLVTDLERMGDHAEDIARIALQLGKEPLIKPLVDTPKMAALVQEMTRESLAAFVDEDEARARAMIEKDHEVDHLYSSIFDELLAMMQRDPKIVRQALLLLQVAMKLERIGDHATNLGEWTIYMLTGQLEDLNT